MGHRVRGKKEKRGNRKEKKADYESTKVRKHEKENFFLRSIMECWNGGILGFNPADK
jgi:hypothetical protein